MQAYLEAMTRMFGACTQRTIDKFSAATEGGKVSWMGSIGPSKAAARPIKHLAYVSLQCPPGYSGQLLYAVPLLYMHPARHRR